MSRIGSTPSSVTPQSAVEEVTTPNSVESIAEAQDHQEVQEANSFGVDNHLPETLIESGTTDGAQGGMRSSLVNVQLAQTSSPDMDQLMDAMELFEEGRNIDPKNLKIIQAAALDTVLRTFDNRFGTDQALLDQVRTKEPHFKGFKLPAVDAEELMGEDLQSQQLQALRMLLLSFQDESDDPLRLAVIGKLAAMGHTQEDLQALVTSAGKGGAAVLYASVSAISKMCGERGNPEVRRRLSDDPVLGPQMQRTDLSPAEKDSLVEKVLKEGTIKKVNFRPGQNRNQVFVVEFEDSVGGEPIRGIFKPEATWFGKDRAYFSREVAAYVFDRDFAKTGLVPMTTSTVIQLGDQHKLGSLQYMVPDMSPLGEDVLNYDPKFDEFRQTDTYKNQIAKLQSLLYIFADPDKLPNDVHATANLQNILVGPDDRLWMIDNSYAMGAAPEISDEMLPDQVGEEMLARLLDSDPEHIIDIMDDIIANRDAGDVVRRLQHALEKLNPQ